MTGLYVKKDIGNYEIFRGAVDNARRSAICLPCFAHPPPNLACGRKPAVLHSGMDLTGASNAAGTGCLVVGAIVAARGEIAVDGGLPVIGDLTSNSGGLDEGEERLIWSSHLDAEWLEAERMVESISEDVP